MSLVYLRNSSNRSSRSRPGPTGPICLSLEPNESKSDVHGMHQLQGLGRPGQCPLHTYTPVGHEDFWQCRLFFENCLYLFCNVLYCRIENTLWTLLGSFHCVMAETRKLGNQLVVASGDIQKKPFKTRRFGNRLDLCDISLWAERVQSWKNTLRFSKARMLQRNPLTSLWLCSEKICEIFFFLKKKQVSFSPAAVKLLHQVTRRMPVTNTFKSSAEQPV